MTMTDFINYISATFPAMKNFYLKYQFKIITTIFSCSFIYLFVFLVPIDIFIAFIVLLASGLLLLKVKWDNIARQGILKKVPARLRTLLLERSLMDIWSDIVYFPTITKVLGAFVRSALVKPPPQKIHEQFKDLSPNFQRVMRTKGLLHLAPSKIQKLFIQKPDQPEDLPQNYGKVSNDWYNIEKYEKDPIKLHEVSIVHNVLDRIDQKIRWHDIAAFSFILSIGVHKMTPRKMSRMMIQNGVFIGMILLTVMFLVKIRKPKRRNNLAHLQLDFEKDV